MNFKPRILTKQCTNTRWVNEVNYIDISSDYHDFEINESHVRNPNYKGKNYDQNYQKNKQNTNYNTNNSNQSSTGYKGNTTTEEGTLRTLRMTTQRSHQMSKLLSREKQLFKIQEILRNPRVYRDKFCPTKVEVNEATVDDVVKYGHLLKRSEAEMAEAIDIYKTLGDDVFYGPEEQSDEHNSEQQ